MIVETPLASSEVGFQAAGLGPGFWESVKLSRRFDGVGKCGLRGCAW